MSLKDDPGSQPTVSATSSPGILVPMASLAWVPAGSADELTIDGTDVYLHACERQASIALRSLLRVWKLEGDPPDPDVWGSVKDVDRVWADLQSAMTAGIILSRLLSPTRVHAHSGLSQTEAQARADARGADLRKRLGVAPNSPLIGIKDVRDSLEHVDERLDKVVAAGDVHSVSDWYLAIGGYFGSTPADAPDPGGRHVNLRTFVPRLGFLIFDQHTVDLFAYEVALQGLMLAVPNARRAARVDGHMYAYGRAQALTWSADIEAARRAEIAKWRGRYLVDAANAFADSFPQSTPDQEVPHAGPAAQEFTPPAAFGPGSGGH